MKLGFVAAVGTALLGSAAARADFIAVYTSNTGNVYNYTLRFTVDVTVPDRSAEILLSGDTVTLYDVAIPGDIISVTPPTSPGGVFTVSQQASGITPLDLEGAAGLVDSPTRQNITFTYVGPQLITPQDFFGASVTMSSGYVGVQVGKEAGRTGAIFNVLPNPGVFHNASVRSVLLPAQSGVPDTPEPGSLVVMGLGAAAMVVRRRRAGSATWSTLI